MQQSKDVIGITFCSITKNMGQFFRIDCTIMCKTVVYCMWINIFEMISSKIYVIREHMFQFEIFRRSTSQFFCVSCCLWTSCKFNLSTMIWYDCSPQVWGIMASISMRKSFPFWFRSMNRKFGNTMHHTFHKSIVYIVINFGIHCVLCKTLGASVTRVL